MHVLFDGIVEVLNVLLPSTLLQLKHICRYICHTLIAWAGRHMQCILPLDCGLVYLVNQGVKFC